MLRLGQFALLPHVILFPERGIVFPFISLQLYSEILIELLFRIKTINMKKAVLILFYGFLVIFFSGFKSSSVKALSWSEFRPFPCYSKIEYSTARGDYNIPQMKYMWYVKFKSSYRNYVSFSYVGIENYVPDISVKTTARTKLSPSGQSSEPHNWFFVAETNSISVWIDNVRVGFDDTGEYSPCGSLY